MKIVVKTLAAAAALVAGVALAGESGPDVLKAKGCNNCHEPDKKKVGPAYKDIAAKDKDKKTADVVAKLKEGKGHPKISASDAELTAAVTHIMSMK